MKKFVCLSLVLLMCACLFASCGKPVQTADGTTDPTDMRTTVAAVPNQEVETIRPAPSVSNNTAQQNTVDRDASDPVYVPVKPVDAEALDLNSDPDISSDDMKFTYDASGRIDTCAYTSDGAPMRLEYAYLADGGISIFGIRDGSMVIDTVYYPTRGFDPALGYTAYDGFYFFGYDFSS